MEKKVIDLKRKIKVLYVDDEENNLLAFRATFRNDFEVFTAISSEEGKRLLNVVDDIEVIISDNKMPNETGIEFFENVFRNYPMPERILISAFADFDVLQEALNRGHIFCFLSKPWEAETLKLSTQKAFQSYTIKKNKRDMIIRLSKANQKLQSIVTRLKGKF